LKDPLIEFIGEIGSRKERVLGQRSGCLVSDRLARAFWPYDRGNGVRYTDNRYRNGSVPEVLQDKKTRFIVDNLQDSRMP
jgi:hypothetical protein